MYSIEDMKAVALKRGGQCVSLTYINQTSKLRWRCGICGLEWLARPAHVMRGSWCPQCGRKKSGASRLRHSVEELDALARERGGRCLSARYLGLKTHLDWRCAEGHEWKASPGSILHGTWCPKCNGSPIYSIDDMQELAASRGGKCLSSQYIRSQSKLQWTCAVGHKWEAVPASIVAGRWCPECGRGLGERICRAFFEQKFGRPFPNSRPKWLLDQLGRPMELDGYCEELKLAFEHHGQQHYRVVGWNLSPTSRRLAEIQARDHLRQELCKRAGVRLVTIPSVGSITRLGDLEKFITGELRRIGVILPKGYNTTLVDYAAAHRKARISRQLAMCREHAKTMGGSCTAVEYRTAREKIGWRCANGHEWQASPDNVLRAGTWCPKCKSQVLRKAFSHTINTMRKIARKRGGRCLSTNYENARSVLEWQCGRGHTWHSAASNVLCGSWCPECAGNARGTLDSMRRLAETRHGKCLATKYINSGTRLTWQCSEGHIWDARPSNVSRGSWCPVCAVEGRKGKCKGTFTRLLG